MRRVQLVVRIQPLAGGLSRVAVRTREVDERDEILPTTAVYAHLLQTSALSRCRSWTSSAWLTSAAAHLHLQSINLASTYLGWTSRVRHRQRRPIWAPRSDGRSSGSMPSRVICLARPRPAAASRRSRAAQRRTSARGRLQARRAAVQQRPTTRRASPDRPSQAWPTRSSLTRPTATLMPGSATTAARAAAATRTRRGARARRRRRIADSRPAA